MQKDLIVAVGTPEQEATALAVKNKCVGFYTGIPPKWISLSNEEGWLLPCVVTTDENGVVVSWVAV